MSLIQLQHVDFSIGGPLLLENVALSIEANERVCIVGRNGEGKSTLMKLIAGELHADDGEIRVQNGVVIARMAQGMADDALMTVLKAAFHDQHGLQCGFCTPGMLVSSWDLIKRKDALEDHDIRIAMSGNLCRCTGYQNIVRSIKSAFQTWYGRPGAPEEAAR